MMEPSAYCLAPRLAAHNATDVRLPDPVPTSQGNLRPPGSMQLSNLYHLCIG